MEVQFSINLIIIHYSVISFPIFIKNTGDTLPEEDIISSYAVHSKIECSFQCLQASTCVGYNYRPKSNRYVVNCQLSSRIRGKDEQTIPKGNWEFYQDWKTVRSEVKHITIKILRTGIGMIIKKLDKNSSHYDVRKPIMTRDYFLSHQLKLGNKNIII